MGVLINEFEIVPAPEGEGDQRPAASARRPMEEKSEQLQASDVYTLIRRDDACRLRVLAH
jgi:hypothetical protein